MSPRALPPLVAALVVVLGACEEAAPRPTPTAARTGAPAAAQPTPPATPRLLLPTPSPTPALFTPEPTRTPTRFAEPSPAPTPAPAVTGTWIGEVRDPKDQSVLAQIVVTLVQSGTRVTGSGSFRDETGDVGITVVGSFEHPKLTLSWGSEDTYDKATLTATLDDTSTLKGEVKGRKSGQATLKRQ